MNKPVSDYTIENSPMSGIWFFIPYYIFWSIILFLIIFSLYRFKNNKNRPLHTKFQEDLIDQIKEDYLEDLGLDYGGFDGKYMNL